MTDTPTPPIAGDGPQIEKAPTAFTNGPDSLLTDQQRLQAYANLYKNGSPDMQQRVVAQATAAGLPLDKIAGGKQLPPLAPTSQTPANANGPLAVPSTPAEYHFEFSTARLSADPTTLAKFSNDLKSALHAAEVPAILAQSVLDALDHSASVYSPTMIDTDRAAVMREEGWRLKRLFGESGATEIVELASAAYYRFPQSWREKIDATFGFHTAEAQVALAGLEREYRQRTGAKP